MLKHTKIPKACFVCGGRRLHKPVAAKWMTRNDIISFYSCEDCNSLTASPLDRTILYNRDSDNTNFDEARGMIGQIKKVVLKLSIKKIIRDVPNKGMALDFGCGSGDVANVLSENFNNVIAADLQAERPMRLLDHVQYMQIKDIKGSGPYDVIIARHVLEHVDNPKKTISILADLLSETGTLKVEVPDQGSIIRRIMGRYWTGYFAPYHVGVFSQEGLQEIAHSLGLECNFSTAEPPSGGVFFMHIGFKRNLARLMALIIYPIQILISKCFGTSEAIRCDIR